jgi:hypothetical protein
VTIQNRTSSRNRKQSREVGQTVLQDMDKSDSKFVLLSLSFGRTSRV